MQSEDLRKQLSRSSSSGLLEQTQKRQPSDLVIVRSALRNLDRSVRLGKQNTFALLLEKCSKLKALPEAKRLHSHISRRGLDRNVFLANFMISMYGHCGSVSDARLVFDNMHKRNVVSWNAMMAVYSQHGHGKRALRLLKHMCQDDLQPRKSTFITALSACAHPDLLKHLVGLHELIAKRGHEDNLVICNALINAYGKCGSVIVAKKVFRKMRERDIISWNSMISAFSHNGCPEKALELVDRMKLQNVETDKVTFVNLLSGCTSKKDLETGMKIYELILKHGCHSNVYVGTALITMFGKVGCLANARESFDRIPYRSAATWNAMIVAYTGCGCNKEALQLFQGMRKGGVKPDKITFTTVLDACTGQEDLEEGRTIHFYCKECKLDQDCFVRSALINMYGKCGSPEEARHVFRGIEPPDLVSTTAMIGTCAHLGQGEEALDLFFQMVNKGMKPNNVTYINILSACAVHTILVEGKMIHSGLIEGRFDAVVEVNNALVNMYSKCGCVEDARKVFDKTQTRTVVSWTAMLDAYASQGYGKEALDLFRRMQQDGVKPDEVTFVSVLTACSHAGLVNEAREQFFSMSLKHSIKPNSSHFTCMIDMFARLGRLDEAESFIKKAPFNVGIVDWMTLLSACRDLGEVELAEHAADQVFLQDPCCQAAYAVMSNIYSKAGRWDDIARLKARIDQSGIENRICFTSQPDCAGQL